MIVIRLLPVILSFILLGAHFSRLNFNTLMLLSVLFPLMLLIKKNWIPKLFQIALIVATIEWLRSLYIYIIEYQQIGKPWTRLLIIIGSVALFTLLSALVFQLKSVKEKYR